MSFEGLCFLLSGSGVILHNEEKRDTHGNTEKKEI